VALRIGQWCWKTARPLRHDNHGMPITEPVIITDGDIIGVGTSPFGWNWSNELWIWNFAARGCGDSGQPGIRRGNTRASTGRRAGRDLTAAPGELQETAALINADSATRSTRWRATSATGRRGRLFRNAPPCSWTGHPRTIARGPPGSHGTDFDMEVGKSDPLTQLSAVGQCAPHCPSARVAARGDPAVVSASASSRARI